MEDVVFDEASVIEKTSTLGDPVKTALQSESQALIQKAIAELSDEDRLLVTLYHIEDLDYDQITRITGISPGNLKVRLFRARQRLKKLYAEQENGEGNELRADTINSTGLRQGSAEFERS